ncbi:MAG: hypothetical protein K0S56_4395 [Microvirga sp.]|jgi:hypothetical protein|nr:hypothetical protein [Microvirga sp.]
MDRTDLRIRVRGQEAEDQVLAFDGVRLGAPLWPQIAATWDCPAVVAPLGGRRRVFCNLVIACTAHMKGNRAVPHLSGE